jgi:hypothetical protein
MFPLNSWFKELVQVPITNEENIIIDEIYPLNER